MLPWDVVGFLSVVTVVYLDYFWWFGLIRKCRCCIGMIKEELQICCSFYSGFIFSCHKDFVLFLFLTNILKKKRHEKFRRNTTLHTVFIAKISCISFLIFTHWIYFRNNEVAVSYWLLFNKLCAEIFDICCSNVLIITKPSPFALEASESQIAGLGAYHFAWPVLMFPWAFSTGHCWRR